MFSLVRAKFRHWFFKSKLIIKHQKNVSHMWNYLLNQDYANRCYWNAKRFTNWHVHSKAQYKKANAIEIILSTLLGDKIPVQPINKVSLQQQVYRADLCLYKSNRLEGLFGCIEQIGSAIPSPPPPLRKRIVVNRVHSVYSALLLSFGLMLHSFKSSISSKWSTEVNTNPTVFLNRFYINQR